VADKRRDFAVSAGQRDALVDTTREVRDPVFEKVVSDLYDICTTREVSNRPLNDTLKRCTCRIRVG